MVCVTRRWAGVDDADLTEFVQAQNQLLFAVRNPCMKVGLLFLKLTELFIGTLCWIAFVDEQSFEIHVKALLLSEQWNTEKRQ